MNLINRSAGKITLSGYGLEPGKPMKVPDAVAKRVFAQNHLAKGDLAILTDAEFEAETKNADKNSRKVAHLRAFDKPNSTSDARVFSGNEKPDIKRIAVRWPERFPRPFEVSHHSRFHGLQGYSIKPGETVLMDDSTFLTHPVQSSIHAGQLEIVDDFSNDLPPAA